MNEPLSDLEKSFYAALDELESHSSKDYVAICDYLKPLLPQLPDEQIYQLQDALSNYIVSALSRGLLRDVRSPGLRELLDLLQMNDLNFAAANKAINELFELFGPEMNSSFDSLVIAMLKARNLLKVDLSKNPDQFENDMSQLVSWLATNYPSIIKNAPYVIDRQTMVQNNGALPDIIEYLKEAVHAALEQKMANQIRALVPHLPDDVVAEQVDNIFVYGSLTRNIFHEAQAQNRETELITGAKKVDLMAIALGDQN